MSESPSLAFRRSVLQDCGATDDTMGELLVYTENAFVPGAIAIPRSFPLPDEPHVAVWESYVEEGRRLGVFQALRARLVQLRFPIRAGLSADASYRAATRRGHLEAAEAFRPGLILRDPEGLDLAIRTTPAGRIPVLLVADREDFIALVRAFTSRNEPEPVPPAMGACIVSKLNNWDRIAGYRAAWEARQSGDVIEGDWQAEFLRLVPRTELYQDRFIILGRQPYSAVGAADVGLDAGDWLDRSLTIRREHEFFHYFTYRVFGLARNNLHDELIADFLGLVAAFGRYEADLALRFLGLEAFPRVRLQGRLETYRGTPPLSDAAMTVVRRIACRAILNLEALAIRHTAELDDASWRTRLTLTLAATDLTELASTPMDGRVELRLEGLAQPGDPPRPGPSAF